MSFETGLLRIRSAGGRRLAVLWAVTVGTAFGQLHLITGSPTHSSGIETYGSSLLRVNGEGGVTEVAELASPKAGTQFIDISYDRKMAVVFSGDHKVFGIDFDKPEIPKECEWPNTPGILLVEWLADSPQRGLLFDWYSNTPTLKNPVVRGMILDPSVPCEESVLNLDPSDIRYVVMHGNAAVADIVPFNPIYASVEEQKDPVIVALGARVPLGYAAPKGLLKGLEQGSAARVNISDSHVFVPRIIAEDRAYRIPVYRKSDKTWRSLPVTSDWPPYVRGFGRFIAATEVLRKSPLNPESAGKAEWREQRTSTGQSISLTMQNDEAVYPGRLYLYDVDTERVHKITTNQGDSEVLLVENSTVYYRVSDRVYSAPITDSGVGPARLVAQAEEIRDAHWAFFKH
jgi:hypothetical protein